MVAASECNGGVLWTEWEQQSTPDGELVARRRRGATTAAVAEAVETTAEATVTAAEVAARNIGADGSSKQLQ